MKILSEPIYDKKINSKNVIVEMSLSEYYDLVKDIMKNNDFQRTRVRSSKNIYSLLKQDLIAGCLIPPIVLSMQKNLENGIQPDESFITENKESLMILDGLQRTYTIQDIVNEAQNQGGTNALQNKIRVEIYFGLNKEGILYRMLTLNTGQTPMKLRHQVEIIYSGLLNSEQIGFKLIKDTEEKQNPDINTFKFGDAVDAFTSYIEEDYLQITRETLLNGIKAFEDLMKLSTKNDLFSNLLRTYSKFIQKVDDSLGGEIDTSELGFDDNPFGKNAVSIFNKSQALTGFGAAISKLIKYDNYTDIPELDKVIEEIDEEKMKASIIPMLGDLNRMKTMSKK